MGVSCCIISVFFSTKIRYLFDEDSTYWTTCWWKFNIFDGNSKYSTTSVIRQIQQIRRRFDEVSTILRWFIDECSTKIRPLLPRKFNTYSTIIRQRLEEHSLEIPHVCDSNKFHAQRAELAFVRNLGSCIEFHWLWGEIVGTNNIQMETLHSMHSTWLCPVYLARCKDLINTLYLGGQSYLWRPKQRYGGISEFTNKW